MKGTASSSRKKADSTQLQIDLRNDKEWFDFLKRPGLLIIDVYSKWCGPCLSIIGHLRKIKMELGDEHLSMATAESDSIKALSLFRNKAEPTFLLFANEKPLSAVHGAKGVTLLQIIRDKFIQYKKGHIIPVIFESLAKPEETFELDEFDDVESEEEEEEAGEKNDEMDICEECVLFISPNIISLDKTEAFLSHIVSAGLSITAHVQKKISREDLHSLLFQEELESESANEDRRQNDETKEEQHFTSSSNTMEDRGSMSGGDQQLQQQQLRVAAASNESTAAAAAEKEKSEWSEELTFWEEELSKGTLYMILIRTDEGSIYETWNSLRGPTDFRKAQVDEPDSLVAIFGDRLSPIPAWVPQSETLQLRLKTRFFSQMDDTTYRLLLLIESDSHQQILNTLCNMGVDIVSHTQVTLTTEAVAELSTPSTIEKFDGLIDSTLFGAVVSCKSTLAESTELSPLYLTPTADIAMRDIGLFFGDLVADLTFEMMRQEEPQTQIELQQKIENGCSTK